MEMKLEMARRELKHLLSLFDTKEVEYYDPSLALWRKLEVKQELIALKDQIDAWQRYRYDIQARLEILEKLQKLEERMDQRATEADSRRRRELEAVAKQAEMDAMLQQEELETEKLETATGDQAEFEVSLETTTETDIIESQDSTLVEIDRACDYGYWVAKLGGVLKLSGRNRKIGVHPMCSMKCQNQKWWINFRSSTPHELLLQSSTRSVLGFMELNYSVDKKMSIEVATYIVLHELLIGKLDDGVTDLLNFLTFEIGWLQHQVNSKRKVEVHNVTTTLLLDWPWCVNMELLVARSISLLNSSCLPCGINMAVEMLQDDGWLDQQVLQYLQAVFNLHSLMRLDLDPWGVGHKLIKGVHELGSRVLVLTLVDTRFVHVGKALTMADKSIRYLQTVWKESGEVLSIRVGRILVFNDIPFDQGKLRISTSDDAITGKRLTRTLPSLGIYGKKPTVAQVFIPVLQEVVTFSSYESTVQLATVGRKYAISSYFRPMVDEGPRLELIADSNIMRENLAFVANLTLTGMFATYNFYDAAIHIYMLNSCVIVPMDMRFGRYLWLNMQPEVKYYKFMLRFESKVGVFKESQNLVGAVQMNWDPGVVLYCSCEEMRAILVIVKFIVVFCFNSNEGTYVMGMQVRVYRAEFMECSMIDKMIMSVVDKLFLHASADLVFAQQRNLVARMIDFSCTITEIKYLKCLLLGATSKASDKKCSYIPLSLESMLIKLLVQQLKLFSTFGMLLVYDSITVARGQVSELSSMKNNRPSSNSSHPGKYHTLSEPILKEIQGGVDNKFVKTESVVNTCPCWMFDTSLVYWLLDHVRKKFAAISLEKQIYCCS